MPRQGRAVPAQAGRGAAAGMPGGNAAAPPSLPPSVCPSAVPSPAGPRRVQVPPGRARRALGAAAVAGARLER